MNRVRPALLAVLAALAGCMAPSTPPAADPGEPTGYVWNDMYAEKLQALRATGDPLRGEIAFEICQGCHRAQALGRPDGTYPRLAGQHATVLIKQMTDVRAGRRHNPRMLPFADRHVISPQDIADIASFLQRLPVPPDNGKGDGDRLARGEALYRRDCIDCHGAAGEGDAGKFFPRVSGQHYRYLLREGAEIRDGVRRNANPKMVRVIRPYDDADLRAVSDYMSRFPLKPAG